VHIPLDYYRILSLPIQATSEQLRQSHRDRTLQLPRREYSDAAIASRKQLLDEAYAVLSNPDHRRTYDASFLAKTYDLTPEVLASTTSEALNGDTPPESSSADAHTPSVEIEDQQLVGAMLILQELGEYELVLKLGRPFLTGGSATLKDGQFGNPNIVYADIVLTVALACLELGREQWQQGQSENAAEALETGQQLLLREGLFAGVRGEIQTDLYKLRPYWILELLALPEAATQARQRGLQLLQEMLDDRGGIDGTADDQSGLSVDDFLRFMQQLRAHLTAAEQQDLFEAEARRPSAVATYLAVYTLLARGFAAGQPALVQRAKLLLQRLGARQDVYLEQAVCVLLLGQTEEATQALELSQEYEPIAYIREHSVGSPDLLPGLCLYAEHWLQDEVFPHFRDLAQKRITLKDYFADRQVQRYLEDLPSDAELEAPLLLPPQSTRPALQAVGDRALRSGDDQGLALEPTLNDQVTQPLVAVNQERFSQDTARLNSDTTETLVEAARARIASRMATATVAMRQSAERQSADGASTPTAERVTPGRAKTGGDRARLQDQRSREQESGLGATARSGSDLPEAELSNRKGRSKGFKFASLLLPGTLLVAMVAGGFAAAWALKNWQAATRSAPSEELLLALDRPLVPLPQATVKPDLSAAVLNNQSATAIVESWLTAKAEAMGPERAIDKLNQVLLEPKLTIWRDTAEAAKRDNWHRKYKHEVKVSAVEQTKDKPNQAKVLAVVSETTEEFDSAGKLKDSKSDQNLQIQYTLTRQENQWRVQNWEVR
jgi:hypothetical protein